MTADEILHQVWVELHKTAHGFGNSAAGAVLSADEFKLYGLLTKRLILACETEEKTPRD